MSYTAYVCFALDHFNERFSFDNGPLADDFKALVRDDGLEYRIKKEIISDNLFGADIEPYSIEIASIKLKILVAASSKQHVDFTELKLNLSCKNVLLTQLVTLSGENFGSFDVIVGNPPYMRVKSMFSGDPDSARLKKQVFQFCLFKRPVSFSGRKPQPLQTFHRAQSLAAKEKG